LTAQVVVRQKANAVRAGSTSATTVVTIATAIARAIQPVRLRRATRSGPAGSGFPGRSVDVSDGADVTTLPTNR
jgi:hypothetical protein